MNVKETGCWQRKVLHWSNCVTGDFGAWQTRAQVQQSFCMPGHTKRSASNFAVALVPGCDIVDGLEHLEP
jgi:hypothetical protein